MPKPQTDDEKVFASIVGLEDTNDLVQRETPGDEQTTGDEQQRSTLQDKKDKQTTSDEQITGDKQKTEDERIAGAKADAEASKEPKPTDEVVGLKAKLEALEAELKGLKQPKAEPQAPAKVETQKKEFKRRWQPKPEDLDAVAVGGEAAQKVLENLYDSLLEDMATLVVPFVQQQINPVQQYLAQAQVAEHTQKFFSKYPDLKDWENECRQVADALLANPQYKAANWDEFYDGIAKQVNQMKEAYAKRFNVQPPAEQPKKEEEKLTPPAADKSSARSKGKQLSEEAMIMEAVLNS